jgi:hypothetical protein
MSLKIRFQKTRSSLGRKLFGVWGVRDYYTRLEQIAADGEVFDILNKLLSWQVIWHQVLWLADQLKKLKSVVIATALKPWLGYFEMQKEVIKNAEMRNLWR